MRYKNIIGKKHGRLTVIKYIRNNKYNHSIWEYKCDCGKICNTDKTVEHPKVVMTYKTT